MRCPPALLLVAGLVGCASAGGREALRDRWSPPEDLLARAARLGSGDPAEREAAEREIGALPDGERCRVLRAGLRLPDGPAAIACAARLPWDWLDEPESARCVELLSPGVFRPDWPGDFNEFRSYLGSEDLGPILDVMAEDPVATLGAVPVADALGELHRIVRPEHLPALSRLFLAGNEEVRSGTFDCIHTILPFTDRHREDVARFLLSAYAPKGWEPGLEGPTGPGYPPLLRTLLRDLYRGEFRAYDEGYWTVRWAADEKPGPDDAAILLRILEGEEDLRGLSDMEAAVFHRALGSLQDGESLAFLRRTADDPEAPADDRCLCLAALALRGEPGALARMEPLAAESKPGWALLASVDPARAAAILRSRLAGPTALEADLALDFLGDSLDHSELCGIDVPPAAFAGVEEAVLGAGLDGGRLARCAVAIPGLRTRRMALAAVEALRRAGPVPDPVEGNRAPPRIPDVDESAFLEVAAPDVFRTLLREWASSDPANREAAVAWARGSLLLLGDPESGPLLARWVRGEPDVVLPKGVYEPDSAITLLARSPCPETEAVLREFAAGVDPDPALEALAGLAQMQGLPPWTASRLAGGTGIEGEDRTPGEQAAVRGAILEGRARDALFDLLERDPHLCPEDIGLLDDPRTAEFLGRRDGWRALGRNLFLFATERAAEAGDAAAEEDLRRAFRAGRYRWIDEATEDGLVPRGDLSTIPFWIDELEASCCRSYKPNWLLDLLFDFNAYRHMRSGVRTPAAMARKWWGEFGPRMRWSRIASRFEAGPAD